MQVAEKHQSVGFQAALRRFWAALSGSRLDWRAPALLAVLVVGFHWKLVLTNQYSWMESPDIANQVLPWIQFQAGEWHEGRVPLWDPTAWGGQPLIGQAQPGAAYPPNWLLYLTPRRLYWVREAALNWYFVLIRVFAALAMYALCRGLGGSRGASMLGGCLYALGAYVGYTMWPQHVNGAVWSPLVFLFLVRASRGGAAMAHALLSGFCLGMGWLAGHHQMNLLISLAAAGLWIWILLRDGWRRYGKPAAAWLAMALAASALQTWPMFEYGTRALRWVGAPNDPIGGDQVVPYNVHAEFSLPPSSLLGIVVPKIEDTNPPFLGAMGFGLAVLGVALVWRTSREARWMTMLAAGGIAFALGPATPLHGWFYSLVPLVEKARSPGAATLLFELGMAPLAALGLDAVSRTESFPARQAMWALPWALPWALAAVGVALVAGGWMAPAIGVWALAVLLAAWRSGALSTRAGAILAVAVALFELTNGSENRFVHRSDTANSRHLVRLSQHAGIASQLYQPSEAYRVWYDEQEIPYNFGAWYGIDTFNAYTASITANTWGMDVAAAKVENFFGIRYFLAKEPPRDDLVEVWASASGVRIFENRQAFPRVWAVHQAVRAEDAPPAMQAIDLRNVAFTLRRDPPALEPCPAAASDDVQMPVHQAKYVRIEANLACRGLVILTDTYYPGWQASVDGRDAEILEVYGGVRGVLVDAGSHTLEMRYRPWSVIGGGLLTGLAGLIAALAGWKIIALRGA